jgi:LytTr DNA-binding domain
LVLRSWFLDRKQDEMPGPLSYRAGQHLHRSVLVNDSCVQEIQAWTTGEYLLRTKAGKEYAVSRTYKATSKLAVRDPLEKKWCAAQDLNLQPTD